ncbi:dermonecrotic toxin domain-containing protein [Pseudomonas sp. NPDC099000]|uniref:dermonecrotic toxin domain-containing protein n=1 Tax=Pseudomonas sp. NPDC099000 TaxID=3364488 RepID=UPI00383AB558
MNDLAHDPADDPTPSAMPKWRTELKAAVDLALPQSPGQFGERLIKEKWGEGIDPQTALLVTLDYHYKGHPAENGIEQGRVASSRSLLQTLMSNYQTVGDGRFAETAFGLYTPPDVGPTVRIVERVDEFADHGSGNHQTYEGIYRQTTPQVYGPLTQINLRPADFKKWVWELELKDVYRAYLDQAWPTDAVLVAARPYALRTSVKAAFVMAAWLQLHEQRLTQKGLALAMRAAGLPADQPWETLTLEQLQAPARVPSTVKFGLLKLYRYTATDIWAFRDTASARVLVYIPGNSSPLHEFADAAQLHQWIVAQGKLDETRQALACHFAEDDREDGTFHAGVLTALDGMALYPAKHWLGNNAGFFNNDGYWDPNEYIGYDDPNVATDPFARLVLTMKQAARAEIQAIRDDAQVNRDQLSAVVEPVVQWVNRFGPLALFVPAGEGLLALAGLIDAGYGLHQAVNGRTSSQRSQGRTRTVFGLLNALPMLGAESALKGGAAEADSMAEHVREPDADPGEPGARPASEQAVAPTPLSNRIDLIRGIGSSVASFSDEVLAQIAKVSAVDDDMLRLMQMGRPPSPLLADTISRFKIDQDLGPAGDAAQFSQRYAVLQRSEHEWVRLFQQQYPDLPTIAIEQMLDRYGIDIKSLPDSIEARQVFARLDGKARQYQQHVRLDRAYEGFYLRSVANAETDTLALHSLKNLPGWPKDLRIEVLDGSSTGRFLDRCGSLDTPQCRNVIKVGNRYLRQGRQTDFYDAVLGVLTDEERSALHLSSADPASALRLNLSDRALSRADTLLGLQRLDTGLTFERQGLRGGGYPTTPQGEAMKLQAIKLQIKDIYPDINDAGIDQVLLLAEGRVQAYIDLLNLQLQQLNVDLTDWVDQAAQDIADMDIPIVAMGDEEAEGMNPAQIAVHNAHVLHAALQQERGVRTELAEELVAIWQKRGPLQDRIYVDGELRGVRLDLAFEAFHRLPTLNARLNDVIELSMRGFHLTEHDSLNGFLESFPNLEVLNLEGVDLRPFFVGGDAGRALPPVIVQLPQLVSLNLRATQLVFTEPAASQLSELTHLQTLDLSDNPLGVPPVVLGMNNLRQLNLRNTGISRCPVGIKDESYLTLLDLRDNRIARVPPAIMNQAVADDRVLLWGNPLTDEDTLRRLISHREQTGVNLWLSAPSADYGAPTVWLRDCDEALQLSRQAIWQRLAGKPSGTRFLAVIDRLSLTPDFRVSYLSLQARVWRLLQEADATDEMWGRLSRGSGRFDHPMAAFGALEERAGF